MKKSFLIPIVSLLLSSCLASGHGALPALGVTAVTLDNPGNPKQIVFQFGTDVALQGEVPNDQQLAAITLQGPGLACDWRFVSETRLACELQKSLPPNAAFVATLTRDFIAKGQQLTEPARFAFATPVPRLTLEHDYRASAFPGNARITFDGNFPLDFSRLQGHLWAEHEDGSKVALSAGESLSNYWRQGVSIAPLQTPKAGVYRFYIDAGYRPAAGSDRMNTVTELGQARYFEHFRYLGLFCEEGNGTRTRLNEDGAAPLVCKSGRIIIGFSRPLASLYAKGNAAFIQDDAGQSPNIQDIFADDGVYYYPAWQPLSDYRLNLSGLQDVFGSSLESTPEVALTTPAPEKYWMLLPPNLVTEADAPLNWQVQQYGFASKDAYVWPIETPQDLQRWLASGRNLFAKQQPTPIWQDTQGNEVDPARWLDSGSGQVQMQVPIENVAYGPQGASAQRAAFNLVALNQDDLLVGAFDWQQAAPLNNVAISRVCASGITALGQTDASGWLQVAELAPVFREDCYLWAQRGDDSALLELQRRYVRNKKASQPLVTAWIAQPVYQAGETLHIGALVKRFNQGWKPAGDMSQYRLTLQDDERVELANWPLSNLSRFGLAEFSYSLADDAKPGHYRLILQGPDNSTQYLSSVRVEEYIAPEFSLSFVDDNGQLPINTRKTVDFSLLQINGQPIQQAKVLVHTEVDAGHAPDSWPQDFEFDFESAQSLPQYSSEISQLTTPGEYQLGYPSLSAAWPFLWVTNEISVTSAAGETRNFSHTQLYRGLTLYPGVRVEENALQVMLLNANGEPALPPAGAKLRFIADNFGVQEVLGQCLLSKTSQTCELPANRPDNFQVQFSAPNQPTLIKSLWLGWRPLDNQRQITGLQILPLQGETLATRAGKGLKLNLQSDIAGTVQLVLQTPRGLQHWQIAAQVGANPIELSFSAADLPSARLYAYMQLPRAQQQDVQASSRSYQASADIEVLPANPPPIIRVTPKQQEVKPGTQQSLIVQSDQDADVQVWLVDKALFEMAEQVMPDLMERLSRDLRQNGYDFYGAWQDIARQLSDKLPPEQLDALAKQTSIRQMAPMMMAEAESQRVSRNDTTEAIEVTGSRLEADESTQPLPDSLFAHSQSLGIVAVGKQQPATLTYHAPMLLSGWQVLALGVHASGSSIAISELEVKQDVEYRLRAPKRAFVDDEIQLNLSFNNFTDVSATDTYVLLNGDQELARLTLTLAPGLTNRSLRLPMLAQGSHQLRLISLQNPDFESRAALALVPTTNQVAARWLFDSLQQQAVRVSQAMLPDSLNLRYFDASEVSPNWQAELVYNRDYLHQCWEQILSRLLAYAYNPQAAEIWPQGKAELQALLAEQARFISRDGYGYFPQTDDSEWLTAYTLLAHSWLKDVGVDFTSEFAPLVVRTRAIRDNSDLSDDARLMANLALAKAGMGAKLAVKDLGHNSPESQLKLLLARQWAGDDVQGDMQTLLDTGYQDTSSSRFGDNQSRCLALMVLPSTHKQHQHILAQVLREQAQQGRFGNTVTNAVCAVALHGYAKQPVMHEIKADSLQKVDEQWQLNLTLPAQNMLWLDTSFQQSLAQLPVQRNGLTVKRQVYRLQGQNWQVIDVDTPLAIGDRIKVELLVESPIERKQIALTDFVPAGWHVVQQDSQQLGGLRSWPRTPVEAFQNKVFFYPYWLPSGSSRFSYQAEVRFAGRYLAPGSQIEAMYQPEVNGRGAASWWQVQP
ncbi:MG2 domain-containing protein [Pseudobowmanella zhangzhouensis]|uniref:MG2 domain-containing protein n=2 Tax=Pseudobowmanella zhangzhouensis TaxID=1537679 RepID=A0ABW1XN24_9ALTE